MLRRILSYGTVAGLLVGIPLFCLTFVLHGHSEKYGLIIGYTTMLIALSTVFVAIKRYRDSELGGVIKFLPAFGLGLGISAVAGMFYALAWEAALAVMHGDFANNFAASQIAHEQARGLSGEALAKVKATWEQWAASYHNPLYRLPQSFTEIFPVGVLVSLVSAALLRNRNFLPPR